MPASSATRRNAPSEWESHKDRILELYLDRNLKLVGDDGVIETMKKEGFTATKSQYETQLRAWDARKYVSSKEWTRIIPIIQQSRERGEAGGIRPLGRVMPLSRVERACRRYASRTRQTDPRDDDRATSFSAENRHTSVEQLAPEIVDIPPFESLEAIDLSTLENLDHFNFNAVNLPMDNLVGSVFQAQGSDAIGFETSPPSNNHDGFGNALDFSLEQVVEVVEMSPIQPPAPNQLHVTGFPFDTTATPVAPAFVPGFSVSNPADAATGKQLAFPRNIWIGVLTSAEIAETVLNSISGAALFNPMQRSISSTSRYRIFGQFISDVNESVELRWSKQHPPLRQPRANAFSPQVYANLLSEEIFVGEERDKFAVLSSDDAFEYRFYTRLIRSMINGCAGLGDIPASSVLRFLNRHHGVQSMLFRFLQSNTKCVAKSLAESTFKAAIEADAVNVAKLLIELRLVDINGALCGGQYTPLQTAAQGQSLEVFKLLLNHGADINKSLRNSNDRALDYLVRYCGAKSTLNQNFLHLVDACVEAGAKITKYLVVSALRGFVDPRLGHSIVPRFVSQTSPEVILDALREHIHEIVGCLNEKDALYMIELTLKSYRESGDWKCRKQLHEIFRKAIKNRNQGIIDIILMKEQDFDVFVSGGAFTAALKSGDQRLLAFLEVNGALDCFSHGEFNELGEAVTTALETGNLILAHKLLECNSYIPGNFLRDSLAFAAANGHDDSVRMLLNAGASIIDMGALRLGYVESTSQQPLLIAIRNSRTQVVRAMLEYEHVPLLYMNGMYRVPPHLEGDRFDAGSAILDAVLECSDDTILDDVLRLMARFCGMKHNIGTLELSFERGGPDLFWKIMNLGCQEPWSLSSALQFAVGREDESLLHELFHFGARPDDDLALKKAVVENPSMVEALLKRFREVYPRGRCGYGVDAMILAIQHFPACGKGLGILLASKATNVNTLQRLKQREGDGAYVKSGGRSPLGIAINRQNGHEVARHDIELVKKLLDADGDANSITTMGGGASEERTALLDAIETGSVEMVQLLLQYGARVNEPAGPGLKRTPLQKAAEVESLEIVRLLLRNDADVNAAPAMRGGATALQLAAIAEHGARFDISPPPGPHGRWPLEGAAENGRLDMIQLIWHANNHQLDNRQCQRAMRLAEFYGHIGCRDKIAELMPVMPAIS
ncbi:ankyrin [Hypoxylon sp. FL1857]|nr:ankyrin [Hypoxylon sp. FL1857]